MEKGLEKGLQQGQEAGEKRIFRQFLTGRFGPLPKWAEERIEIADLASIERWASGLARAASLEEALS